MGNEFLLFGFVMVGLAGSYLYRVRERATLPSLGALMVGTLVWSLLPVGFFVLLYFSHRIPLEPLLGIQHGFHKENAVPFLTAYLGQRILVTANLMLVAILFTHDRVPYRAQIRVLRWMLVAVILTRVGAFGLARVFPLPGRETLCYLLGGLLLWCSLQVLNVRTDRLSTGRLSVGVLKQLWPRPYPRFVEDWFFVPLQNSLRWTPLFATLITLIGVTLMLGLATVPSFHPVRQDVLLGMTASVFSVIGMHVTYLFMARLLQRIRHLKTALGFSISVLGTASLMIPHRPLPDEVLLTILLTIMGIGLIGSIRFGGSDPASLTAPLPPADVMQFLIDNARRLVVSVVGFTLMILGILMLVLPGPGVLTVLAALAVLGMEFVWARKLLRKSKESTKDVWGWFMKRIQDRNQNQEEEHDPDSPRG